MDDSPFAIDLLSQHWLGDDGETQDLCSHGSLALSVGGVRLADGSEDYGISGSALALLRTLERDHSPGSPLAERLVFRGCGTILMMGCPIGIDCLVRHESGSVRLDGIVVHPSTNEDRDAIRSDAVALLPLAEYRSQVFGFAESAREFDYIIERRRLIR